MYRYTRATHPEIIRGWLYGRNNDVLHTMSDGQKCEVCGESLHKSSSFKYFGQGQGGSSDTYVGTDPFLYETNTHSVICSQASRLLELILRHITDVAGAQASFFRFEGLKRAPRLIIGGLVLLHAHGFFS
ncbi:MAG: transposase [Proteobacteria bacterium]|nr:transposase [Pseudomonadota bacterium]